MELEATNVQMAIRYISIHVVNKYTLTLTLDHGRCANENLRARGSWQMTSTNLFIQEMCRSKEVSLGWPNKTSLSW